MRGNEAARGTTPRPGRRVMVATALGALLIAGYFAAGMPLVNRERSSDIGPMAPVPLMSMDQGAMALMSLDPADFAARLAGPSALVINVHTPYEGEIDGTDLFIAFDKIADDNRLPTDKGAEILLYCKSGRMSRIAGGTLVAAGYRNVTHLQGGMDSWKAAGMPLRSDASKAGG